jgi:hypothetical protein
MTSRALDHVAPPPAYGWSAEGKTPAEIAGDIRQTRYRMEADLHALGERLSPKRLVRRAKKVGKWPAAGVALALIALWIRRRIKR